MPCTFDPSVRSARATWRSADTRLRPSANQAFTIGTTISGGGCGHCGNTVRGVAWTSMSYVLCQTCAVEFFNAPDLAIVAPELLGLPPRDEDEDYEDMPDKLETKRDKDFDPRRYKPYTHNQDLSDRYGCAGYRCETFAAPHRTIPANTPFMLGEGNRMHLCMGCFNKLKAKYDALPERDTCSYCDRRVIATRMRDVMHWREPKVCYTCLGEYFLHCPQTDGGYIERSTAVWAMSERTETQEPMRMYASPTYAARHWVMGRDRWYISQDAYDREYASLDTRYRDAKLAEHSGHTIFSYGTNVIKMLGFPETTKRDELCYGVELEMVPNRTHTHANVVQALGGKFVQSAEHPYILCRDGSLGNDGVEMITLPYTLANHKSDKFMPWTKVLTELRKVAMSGQNTKACGMHVHINRRALSHLQIGKMLVVINAPEMQELIATIAQRSEASYCRRYVKKVADGGKIIGEHSDALNCSNGKGTVELRIFRGNLRYERVMKNLEFTDALCNYAAEQSIQKVHIPAEMVAWMNDNKAHYPHLVKFVAEEYQPTKAFSRVAYRIRKEGIDWGQAVEYVTVEPTEGDI